MPQYNRLFARLERAEQENMRLLDELKAVSKAIAESGIEQPSMCLFGGGSCGYPIDDCHHCPVHEWETDFPMTRCEFK